MAMMCQAGDHIGLLRSYLSSSTKSRLGSIVPDTRVLVWCLPRNVAFVSFSFVHNGDGASITTKLTRD